MNPVVHTMDVNDIVQRVDWNDVVDRIDWNNLLDHVDLDRLVERIDMDRLLERVPVNDIIERSNLGLIVARSTTGIFTHLMDVMRAQLILADHILHHYSVPFCRCRCLRCKRKKKKNEQKKNIRRSKRYMKRLPPQLLETGGDLRHHERLHFVLPPRPGAEKRTSVEEVDRISLTTLANLALAVQGRASGVLSRTCAFAIDQTVVWSIFMMCTVFVRFFLSWSGEDVDRTVGSVLWYSRFTFFCLFFLYEVLCLAAVGRTIGKGLIGLRVVKAESGKGITLGDATGRAFMSSILLFLPVYILPWTLVRMDRRGLHDVLTGTTVVYAWNARTYAMREGMESSYSGTNGVDPLSDTPMMRALSIHEGSYCSFQGSDNDESDMDE